MAFETNTFEAGVRRARETEDYALAARAMNTSPGGDPTDASWAANYLCKRMIGIDSVDGSVFNDSTPMEPGAFLAKMQKLALTRDLDTLKSDRLKEWEKIDANDLEARYTYATKNNPKSKNEWLGDKAGRIASVGRLTPEEMSFLTGDEKSEVESWQGAKDAPEATMKLREMEGLLREYEDKFDAGEYVVIDDLGTGEGDARFNRRPATQEEHERAENELREKVLALRNAARGNADESVGEGADAAFVTIAPRIRELKDLAEKRKTVAEYERRLQDENTWMQVMVAKKALGEKAQRIIDIAEAHKGEMEHFIGADFAELAREDPAEARKLAPVLKALQYNPGGNTVAGDAWRAMVRTTTDTLVGAAQAVVNSFERGIVNGDEYQKRRERESIYRRAFEPKMKDHDWFGDAAVGFFGTLPYMGIAAIPYAGTAAIALSAANDFEQQVVDAGGNVADPEFFFTKFAVGATYAAIEKMQVIHPLRKVGDFGTAKMYAAVFSSVKDFAKVAAHQGLRLGGEVWEEGLQGALEKGFVAYGCGQDVAAAVAKGLVQEMHGSIGPFMPLMLTEAAGTRAAYRRGGYNATDIVQANQVLRGFQDKAELAAADAASFGDAYGAIARTWVAGGANAGTRAKLLQARFGMTATEAADADAALSKMWRAIDASGDEKLSRQFFGGRLRTAAELMKDILRDAKTGTDEKTGDTWIEGFIGESGHKVRFTFAKSDLGAVDIHDANQVPSIVNALNTYHIDTGNGAWTPERWNALPEKSENGGPSKQGYADKLHISGTINERTIEVISPDGTESSTVSATPFYLLSGRITQNFGDIPVTVFHEAMHAVLFAGDKLMPKELMDALKEAYPAVGANEQVDEETLANAFRDFLTGKVKLVEEDRTLLQRFLDWITSWADATDKATDAALATASGNLASGILFNKVLAGDFSGVEGLDAKADVVLARERNAEAQRRQKAREDEERKAADAAKAEAEEKDNAAAQGQTAGQAVEKANAADGRFAIEAVSPAEDAQEAQRQYDEVVARYTNPDGTRKPGWMMAPNGRPTNLAERQWVQVRTPNFKENYFGEWEAVAELAGASIDEAKETFRALMASNADIRTADGATLHFASQASKAYSREAEKESSDRAAHWCAVRNIEALIGRARFLYEEKPRNGSSDIDAYVKYGAVFTHDGQQYLAKITSKRYPAKSAQNFYSVESVSVEKIADRGIHEAIGKQQSLDTVSVNRIARLLEASKPENVSKVVDENGEPLVVWHGGADNSFTVFEPARTERGIYFAPDTRRFIADYFADGNARAFFLNLRSPAETTPDGKPDNNALPEGHDGWIVRAAADMPEFSHFDRRTRQMVRESLKRGDVIELIANAEGYADYDLRRDIADALKDYIDFKKGGGTDIEAYLAQRDMFKERPSLTEAIVREIFSRRQSAQRVADIFKEYVRTAFLQSSAGDNLFGMEATPREAVWRQAVDKANAADGRFAIEAARVGGWFAIDDASFAKALGERLDEGIAAKDYRLRNDEERSQIASGARRFFNEFSKKQITLSDGRIVYFAPSDITLRRAGGDIAKAWAIYAIHAATSGGKKIEGRDYTERLFNPAKVALLDDIERIIGEENVREQIRDGRPEEDGVVFYGTSNGRNVSIVTRLDEYGNVDADLTEVTANTPRKMQFPPFTPLTEAVERVAIHQGAGSSSATVGDSVSKQNGENKQDRYSIEPLGTAASFEIRDEAASLTAAKTEAQEVLDLIHGTELGNAINRDFKGEGQTTIIGRTVRTAGDLAAAAQIYRNPCFETMRYFFTKNGKVVWQTAVTSRMPGSTQVFVLDGKRDNATLAEINRMAAALEPDGLWILHNHPSGNVTPSREDLRLTDRFISMLDGGAVEFKGHVIIDHDKYAFIPADGGEAEQRERNFSRNKASFHGEPAQAGVKITTPGTVRGIALAAAKAQQAASEPGKALTIVAAGARAETRAVATMPTDEATGLFMGWALDDYAAATGGANIFVVGDIDIEEYPIATRMAILGLCASGVVRDFIYPYRRGNITEAGSAFAEGRFQAKLLRTEPAMRVAEQSGPRFSVTSLVAGGDTNTELGAAGELTSDRVAQLLERYSIGSLFTGSAADYDAPSLHYIGTGEGSQVYGWGLYASSVRGVAEGYAGFGSDNDRLLIDGRAVTDNEWREISGSSNVKMSQLANDIARNPRNLNIPGQLLLFKLKYGSRVYEWVKENADRISAESHGGNLYEQTFFTNRSTPEETERHLLKWYEPVTDEQRKWVRDAIWEMYVAGEFGADGTFQERADAGGTMGDLSDKLQDGRPVGTGEVLYNEIATILGSPKAASEFLARAGIDGVKYPVDSYGKTVKDGDEAGWNYVSFRDDNIRVDHKWVDGQQRFSIVSSAEDAAYMDAVKRGDMETAQRMLRDVAARRGWSDDDSWRMGHKAPNIETVAGGGAVRMSDIGTEADTGLMPEDIWTHPDWYFDMTNPENRESFYAVSAAIREEQRHREAGDGKHAQITMYRGVDKTKNRNESKFRNGDWVTPSRSYALAEARDNQNGGRVIEMKVSLANLYWTGDSIAEFGYDSGKGFTYKDTKNNRKLLEPTYDADGNLIPLSKRFNERNPSIRYSIVSVGGYDVALVQDIDAARNISPTNPADIEAYILDHLEDNIPMLAGGTASINADTARHFAWSKVRGKYNTNRRMRKARAQSSIVFGDLVRMFRADATTEQRDYHGKGEEVWKCRLPFGLPVFGNSSTEVAGGVVYDADVIIKDEGEGKYLYDVSNLKRNEALTQQLTAQANYLFGGGKRAAEAVSARAPQVGTSLSQSAPGVNGNPQSIADVMPGERDSIVADVAPGAASRSDYMTAWIVQDKLRGIQRPPEKYAELAKALGLRVENGDVSRFTEAADKLIESKRKDLERLAADTDVNRAVGETARVKARDEYAETVKRIFGRSAAWGTEVGGAAMAGWHKVMRDLMALAPGYDLTAMREDTGADLTLTLMEILPELFAASDTDESAKKDGESEGDDGNGGADGEFVGPPSPQTWEEWQKNAAERRKRYNDAIVTAKAWVKARQERLRAIAEARRKAAEEARRKAEEEGKDGDKAESEAEKPETDGTPDTEESVSLAALPLEIIEGHGVDLSNADEFAAFMRAWICHYLVRQNPGRTVEDILQDGVALATYRRTVIAQLRDMANALLDPLEGKSAIAAERMIADIRENATANEIERRTSDIIAFIQRNAIRQKRKSLIGDTLAMIEQMAIKGKKFDALERDMKRKVRGDHEAYCRYIARVIQMSDGAIARETERLTDIIEGRRAAYGIDQGGDVTDGKYLDQLMRQTDDVEIHKAYEKLAALQQYGGLKNKMPSYIVAASKQLEQWLGRERMEHERRWGEFQAVCDEVADAIAEGVRKGREKYAPETPGLGGKAYQDIVASVRQRLEDMLVGADSESRRDAIARVMRLLSEGSQEREVLKSVYRRQFEDAMADAVSGTELDVKGLMRLLDEKIPEELNDALDAEVRDADGNIVHARQRVRMTWGQAMQLYASLVQTATYGENIALHERQGQAEAIRKAAHPALLKLVQNLQRTYQERRGRLSETVMQVTGMPIYNPDPLYMPVRMYTGAREGLDVKTYSWSPLAKSLTPRIRNNRDFDLSADLLGTLRQRTDEAVNAISFGVRGIALRSMLFRKAVVDAMAQSVGKYETRRLVEQVTDTLTDGYSIDEQKGGLMGMLSAAGTFTTYASLSFNVVSALKQAQSISAWVPLLDGGYMELARHIASFDADAAKELIEAPGFTARYGNGSFGQMVRDAFSQTEGSLVKRLAQAGMSLVQMGDFVPGILVGTGFYKARIAALMRQNPNADGAAIRQQAATETWALIEECQQTGRLEDTPHMLRRWGVLGRQVTKFATAPLQQVAHELHAFKMWRKAAAMGNKETADEYRRKCINTFISNHVILPAAFYAVATLFGMALGDEPPEENELFGDLLMQMVAGPFSRVFFAGAIIDGLVGHTVKATGLKPHLYEQSDFPAVRTVKRLIDKGFLTASDIATADAKTVANDFFDMLGIVNAPTRYTTKAVRNYTGYDQKKHRREAIKARAKERERKAQ